jgi:tripartite-type tricarboxylate transporter receptor subunit TctC
MGLLTKPIKSLDDLVKRAKASPGKLTYSITALGSSCWSAKT